MPGGFYSDEHKLEGRLVLDHDYNDYRLAINPILTLKTSGEKRGRTSFSLDTGLYDRRHYGFQPGLELYDDFGDIGHMPSLRDQSHVLFLTGDFRWQRKWLLHTGVGAGLTRGSDGLTVEAILTYEFPLIKPKRLFHGRPPGIPPAPGG